MGYDIYGNSLRAGHCEVHPHVHEEYPCGVCISESQGREQQGSLCDGNPRYCEASACLAQASDRIAELEAENQRLRQIEAAALELLKDADLWDDGEGGYYRETWLISKDRMDALRALVEAANSLVAKREKMNGHP